MVGAEVSVGPIAVGFAIAVAAFVLVGVPWLVRESRRPVRVRPVRVQMARVPREPDHTALSTIAICTQSLLVSILPRHTTPGATDAADTWRTAFAHGRRCEARPRAVWFAPAVDTRSRPSPPRGAKARRARANLERGRRPSTPDVPDGGRRGHRAHPGSGGRAKQFAGGARTGNPGGQVTRSKAQLRRPVER